MSGFHAGGVWWDVSNEDNDLIKDAAEKLAVAGIDNALGEVRRLWSAAAPRKHENAGEFYNGVMADRFNALVNRRIIREPLSHLLGYRDFYKHRFIVSSDVLDPRPDTETLIIEALKVPFQTILDLGTGSGCIVLSLLAENMDATGVATDISQAALEVARRNASKLELEHRLALIQSDWFVAVEDRFDLIVSNPPYIAAEEMGSLQPEVAQYEPRMALTDEGDGLSCYHKIIHDSQSYLTPGGTLMFEIGPSQAQAVSAMMRAQGFAEINTIPDLDGRDRVVCGRCLA